jgi:hypothetical protein
MYKLSSRKILNLKSPTPETLPLNGKKGYIREVITEPEESYKVAVYIGTKAHVVTATRDELLPSKRTKAERDAETVRHFQGIIFEIYHDAQKKHYTLSILCDCLNNSVYNQETYKILPYHCKNAVTCYASALWDVLQSDWLETRWLIDGEWKVRSQIERWNRVYECKGFWKGTTHMFD